MPIYRVDTRQPVRIGRAYYVTAESAEDATQQFYNRASTGENCFEENTTEVGDECVVACEAVRE